MIRWILLSLYFMPALAFSQNVVSGVVQAEDKTPIQGVSVLIIEQENQQILTYDISDKNGRFTIDIPVTDALLDLHLKLIGYQAVSIPLEKKSQTQNFTLKEVDFDIDEVIVKAKPIQQVGDTIIYSTSQFAKANDRTIGDVLNRLPGIEISEDGRIYYQGLPINKYYIEEMDLLGGRYNLANENLPHLEVSEIQILENHQPIKILDSLVYSENAAVNLKLKNSSTFTGQAELGAGLSPLLWKANATPILLNKNHQTLFTYQTNNIGENINRQIKSLTINELQREIENNLEGDSWFRLSPLRSPNINEKHWLDNNSHLVSANLLTPLNKDLELRINASYLNDYQHQSGTTLTTLYTQVDTISLIEETRNKEFINSVDVEANLRRNVKDNFLQNETRIKRSWNAKTGNVLFTTNEIQQRIEEPSFELNNTFESIFSVGDQLLTLQSLVSVKNLPQSLQFTPGQFDAILNEGIPYEKGLQELSLNNFYTTNSISFTKQFSKVTFSPSIGFNHTNQSLETDLFIEDELIGLPEFSNRMDWVNTNAFLELESAYKTDKFYVNATAPLYYNDYSIQNGNTTKKDVTKFTFNPRLRLKYFLTPNFAVSTSIGRSNRFGTIQQMNEGYLFSNYRSLNRYNSPLLETQTNSIAGNLQYKNPLQSLFTSLTFSVGETSKNLLNQSEIDEFGRRQFTAIIQDNDAKRNMLQFRFQKLFDSIHSNFFVTSSYNSNEINQIINSEISVIELNTWQVAGGVDVDITDYLSTQIKTKYLSSNNSINKLKNNTIQQEEYSVLFNVFPKNKHFLQIENELIRNELLANTNSLLFSNFLYRFSFGKQKVDAEFGINNLWNVSDYQTVRVNDISYIETDFQLRPRQAVLSATISF